jgi:hypothetical protein
LLLAASSSGQHATPAQTARAITERLENADAVVLCRDDGSDVVHAEGPEELQDHLSQMSVNTDEDIVVLFSEDRAARAAGLEMAV